MCLYYGSICLKDVCECVCMKASIYLSMLIYILKISIKDTQKTINSIASMKEN